MDIKDILKVELHCHLIGVLNPTYLKALAAEGHEMLINADGLAALYPVKNKNDFQKWIQFTKPYQTNSLKYLLPILEMHIKQLKLQRVVYTELMISPSIFSSNQNIMIRELNELKAWLLKQEDADIQVEFLMVIPRTIDDEKLKKDILVFIDLFKAGLIVGVAMVGIEDNKSIKRFAHSFKLCKEAGLGIEIHAGEHSGPETIWEAINFGHADRIGHGISLFDDSELLKLIKKRNIHVEFCVTSNLKTQSVALLQQHPISKAMDLQLNYSINTDDPGIFLCDLNHEYTIARNYLNVSDNEFNRIYTNTLKARFQKELRYLVTTT